MIANATGRHCIEREGDLGSKRVVFVAIGCVQQQREFARHGKLRPVRASGIEIEAAELRIVRSRELLDGRRRKLGRERRVLHGELCGHHSANVGRQNFGVRFERLAVVTPQVGDDFHHRREALASLGVIRREISSTRDRLPFGGHEHRQRPAAVLVRAAHAEVDRQRGHVDVVDVRPLFAIDFDADEVVVHVLGDRLIREDQPLHDVAPVTTGVADRQEDQLPFLLRLLECFRPPREPIDRVVRVHQQVRAGLLREPIGLARFVSHLLLADRLFGKRGADRRLGLAGDFRAEFVHQIVGLVAAGLPNQVVRLAEFAFQTGIVFASRSASWPAGRECCVVGCRAAF